VFAENNYVFYVQHGAGPIEMKALSLLYKWVTALPAFVMLRFIMSTRTTTV